MPEDIPAFLGTGPVKSAAMRRARRALLGVLRAWAAATALSPDPVDDASAFALRAHLGLELSSWDFRDLVMAAERSGDRLVWSPSQRAELVNWLTQCSQKAGQVDDDSPLARALEYWIHAIRTRAHNAGRSQIHSCPGSAHLQSSGCVWK